MRIQAPAHVHETSEERESRQVKDWTVNNEACRCHIFAPALKVEAHTQSRAVEVGAKCTGGNAACRRRCRTRAPADVQVGAQKARCSEGPKFCICRLKGRCAEALCEGAAGFQVACTLTASV